MIDWKTAQKRLGVTPDGVPGRLTYSALLRVVGATAKPEVIDELARACIVHLPAYQIDATPARLANFLGQGSNETGGFTVWEENLRYSAKRITQVWPSRFPTLASALPFAWDPSDPDREDIALANKVYGGRMGNELNGTDDDDGWDWRGSGFLMLTFRANYEAAEKRLGLGILQHPDLARLPAVSLLIACDFWRAGNVNAAIDRGDLKEARRITNGGAVGLDNVLALDAKLMRILG
ncbi:glycoside hydrolase family 19 protein [Rhizorhabdus wittichii]|uniref:Glycoside hydrolase family 19 protein n=1 Tax=Rhizorhabdus wittichii TaxID=160791 RepID=A0A975CZ62_9SPHN|nr:glycoside hydrolase family 19 protein [Rhizorhabdus wittichii]QTH19673.1 glycoside hydrolase family 19 protein [Rhizorhabdus wittichii]